MYHGFTCCKSSSFKMLQCYLQCYCLRLQFYPHVELYFVYGIKGNTFYHYCCQQCFSCTLKQNLALSSSSQKATLSKLQKAGVCAACYTYLHRHRMFLIALETHHATCSHNAGEKQVMSAIYKALPNWSAFLCAFEKKRQCQLLPSARWSMRKGGEDHSTCKAHSAPDAPNRLQDLSQGTVKKALLGDPTSLYTCEDSCQIDQNPYPLTFPQSNLTGQSTLLGCVGPQ